MCKIYMWCRGMFYKHKVYFNMIPKNLLSISKFHSFKLITWNLNNNRMKMKKMERKPETENPFHLIE